MQHGHTEPNQSTYIDKYLSDNLHNPLLSNLIHNLKDRRPSNNMLIITEQHIPIFIHKETEQLVESSSFARNLDNGLEALVHLADIDRKSSLLNAEKPVDEELLNLDLLDVDLLNGDLDLLFFDDNAGEGLNV